MKNKNREIREWLKGYSEIEEELVRELESAEYWRDKAYSLSAVNLENLGIKGRKAVGSEDYVIKFMDLVDRCTLLAEKAQDRKEAILKAIEEIPDAQARKVLKLRYLDGLTFEAIAREMSYSLRWVFDKHRAGLETIRLNKLYSKLHTK